MIDSECLKWKKMKYCKETSYGAPQKDSQMKFKILSEQQTHLCAREPAISCWYYG